MTQKGDLVTPRNEQKQSQRRHEPDSSNPHFSTVMHRITTLRPTTDRIYHGGPIKGKVVPSQVWSGPEGSRKFPDYMTTAQDGGKVVSPTHRPPWYSFLLETESTPGP